MNVNDYRRRAARSEIELKRLLLGAGWDARHLSPEDSPDIVAISPHGRIVWVEAKVTTKDSFYAGKDAQTRAQFYRLAALHDRSAEWDVWYAVQFADGWKFYPLGSTGLHMGQGNGLELLSFLGGYQ